jgi:hypothetical protein
MYIIYLSLKQKKESLFLMTHLVDNSIEISNISLTPKDLIDTHHIMTLIMKS